jgi:hypothetical protein
MVRVKVGMAHHKEVAGYNLPSLISLWIYTMTRCTNAKAQP